VPGVAVFGAFLDAARLGRLPDISVKGEMSVNDSEGKLLMVAFACTVHVKATISEKASMLLSN
jgi:hypothetical protein